MNIVILGPQGSGKGTQAEMIAKKYNLIHVETGKILREIASTHEGALAEEVGRVLAEGRLVSDVVLEQVLNKIFSKSNGKGFIFDGTPRNDVQYNLMKRVLHDRGEKIDKIILINISEKESIRRLVARRTCKVCGRVYNLITNPPPGDRCECGGELIHRDDDKPDTIRKRLQEYRDKTSVVISSAKDDGILYEIDGERPIDVIFEDIVKVIDNI